MPVAAATRSTPGRPSTAAAGAQSIPAIGERSADGDGEGVPGRAGGTEVPLGTGVEQPMSTTTTTGTMSVRAGAPGGRAGMRREDTTTGRTIRPSRRARPGPCGPGGRGGRSRARMAISDPGAGVEVVRIRQGQSRLPMALAGLLAAGLGVALLKPWGE